MLKTIYNTELLNNIVQKDNAELLKTYNKCNRDTIIEFTCSCGNNYSKKFRYINEAGAKCQKCTNTSKQERRKKTNLNKYGVEHVMQLNETKERIKKINLNKYGVEHALQSKELKEKAKQTMLNRYGVEHALKYEEFKNKATNTIIEKFGVENVSQSNTIREKVRQTNLNRYGVEYTMMNKEVKEKAINTMLNKYNAKVPLLNPELRDKIIKTNIKKYGVEYAIQSSDIKEKAKQTNIKKYGVEYASQSDIFKDKYKQTCLERYGVEHLLQSDIFKDKYKQTCLERYGVEYASQCQEIMERTQKNAKKFKEYTMPSGNKLKVQGYEPFALDELVKKYEEVDIITQRKEIPRIKYNSNDKQKYYFPDIYIKSINTIIEVKSTWTYKCKEDIIQLKADATKLAGYNYEIWIYDSKGNKTVK
jgi:hypothetical protein